MTLYGGTSDLGVQSTINCGTAGTLLSPLWTLAEPRTSQYSDALSSDRQ